MKFLFISLCNDLQRNSFPRTVDATFRQQCHFYKKNFNLFLLLMRCSRMLRRMKLNPVFMHFKVRVGTWRMLGILKIFKNTKNWINSSWIVYTKLPVVERHSHPVWQHFHLKSSIQHAQFRRWAHMQRSFFFHRFRSKYWDENLLRCIRGRA